MIRELKRRREGENSRRVKERERMVSELVSGYREVTEWLVS